MKDDQWLVTFIYYSWWIYRAWRQDFLPMTKNIDQNWWPSSKIHVWGILILKHEGKLSFPLSSIVADARSKGIDLAVVASPQSAVRSPECVTSGNMSRGRLISLVGALKMSSNSLDHNPLMLPDLTETFDVLCDDKNKIRKLLNWNPLKWSNDLKFFTGPQPSPWNRHCCLEERG